MTALEAIKRLEDYGASLRLKGDQVAVRNMDSVPPEVVEEARKLKPEIIQVLRQREEADLEFVLKGLAIELWSDLTGERLWLVSDEADAARLGEPRGSVYTASEARMVTRITDPTTVKEIHAYKKDFGGVVSEYIDHKGGAA